MPTTTPLTDAINALTQYANETTGASDTTLSDAVGTLVAGYGGGGGSSYTLEINNVTPTTDRWNSVALPNNMSTGGALEVEFVMSSQTNLPNIISIGTNLSNLGNWSTANAIHIFQRTALDGIAIRQNSATTEWEGLDPSVPHTVKIDKDYVYVDGVQAVATANNVKNATTLMIGSAQGSNRFTGTINYIRFG